ncbi:hypothetical protein [Ralstonia mannitolilytica]|uniref:hypothetical protein n=1 Tax=Ralstonia mannitolilytica TaxID=105219 RepID=UPI001C95AF4C|nr:hypothetical protein [Ralstonia mannitolilytica]MBY4719876.1 hypothetical protein [Ralstonia mannitolilytica]
MATIIAGASVVPRGADHEGNPRIVIQAAAGGFVYSRETARAWFIARWPSLSDAQMRRALQMLAAHVRNRMERSREDSMQRLAANHKRWRDHARDNWFHEA